MYQDRRARANLYGNAGSIVKSRGKLNVISECKKSFTNIFFMLASCLVLKSCNEYFKNLMKFVRRLLASSLVIVS